MAGIGSLIGIFGNLLTQSISSSEKNKTAADENRKASDLERQANQVVAKDPTKDPAYKMKAFLAAAGIPGYEEYLKEAGTNEADALEKAEKVAGSGSALLNTLGALESSKNKQINSLESKNSAYIEGKKIDLADTRYSEQEHFNELALKQKSNLNYAATSYENAALEQHQAAQDQMAGAVGNTLSSLGSMGNLFGGGGKIPKFGTLSTFGTGLDGSGGVNPTAPSGQPDGASELTGLGGFGSGIFSLSDILSWNQ